jgi:signal transduction histidine kinase
MFRTHSLILISFGFYLNLFSQATFPKCFDDYVVVQNIDSLEKVVNSNKENSLAYMHGLITLQLSRSVYSEKSEQDLALIKEITTQQNDELGKTLYLIFEAKKSIRTNRAKAMESLYTVNTYFENTKDTVGIMYVCRIVLEVLQNYSNDTYLSKKESVENWYNKLINLGKITSKEHAKLHYYIGYIQWEAQINNRTSPNLTEELKMVNLALDIINRNPKMEYLRYDVYLSLASLYNYKDDYAKLIECSLINYKNCKHRSNLLQARSTFNLAVSYYNNSNFDLAEKYYTEAYDLIKKNNINDIILTASIVNQLSYSQYSQKKFKQAFETKVVADSLETELNEKIKAESIVEIETRYEVEKKEVQNSSLIQEQKSLQIRAYILLISIIVVSLLLLFLGKIYTELRHNREVLAISKQELEKNSYFRERIFSMIAHDLRSPIISYTGIVDMVNYLIKNKRFDDLNKVALQLDNTSIGLTNLIDNLLLWSMNQKQYTRKEPTPIFVKEAIQNILPIYSEMADWHNIDLDVFLQKNLCILAEENGFNLIIRNLLDNAIKNTEDGQNIKIEARAEQDNIYIAFTNKPKVLDLNVIQKIQYLFSEAGFDLEVDNSGLGLGIIMINEFVKNNNGSIALFHNSDDTLTFNIKFLTYLGA